MSLISAGKEYPVGLSIVVPVYRGAGTVGAALVAMLNDHTRDAALHEAVGGTVEIVGIAVRDLQRHKIGAKATALGGIRC